MKLYKCLSNNQTFQNGKITVLPIRNEDKYDIMKWRNEQMFHLRQEVKLTKKMQELYFDEVITPSFEDKYPNQILFSVLENQKCIGYGGLVHIDWKNSNAEISFLIDTQIENGYFKQYWELFLSLVSEVAFKDLSLKKIYVYSFNLRPLLYEALKNQNFQEEARLIQHKKVNNYYVDVRIHSKFRL